MSSDTKDKFKEELTLLDNAIVELENHCTIKYKTDDNPTKNEILPNSWYITPYGALYNTGNGHQITDLSRSYNDIKTTILFDGKVPSEKMFLEEYSEIIRNGFVDWLYFRSYLHYTDGFAHILISHDYEPMVTHDSHIINTLLGVISAHAGLFSFFRYMQENTVDPKKELKVLLELTFNQFSDILVRCAGFHKVENVLNKTITTSFLTPYEEFIEYLKRGWDVCFISPIVVDKENGIIKEIDINSPIVDRQIEKNIKRYEKHKQAGYGRIY